MHYSFVLLKLTTQASPFVAATHTHTHTHAHTHMYLHVRPLMYKYTDRDATVKS